MWDPGSMDVVFGMRNQNREREGFKMRDGSWVFTISTFRNGNE